MWLVNLALRNPYTVYVAMLLTAVLGGVGYWRTPADILPKIKVPVVVVFASYRGMPAPDMEKSVTSVLERALTRCDHLEHIESKSVLGIAIIKVFFREQVDPDVAASQVISLVNGEMQNMPPGMLPPSVLKYDASAIPVGNLVISSNSRDDRELLDIADHQLRDELAATKNFAGVTGIISMDRNRNAVKPAVVLKLEDGRYIYQGTIQPGGEVEPGSLPATQSPSATPHGCSSAGMD